MNNRSQSGKRSNDILRYASLGTQLLVSIGLAVFIGMKADKWLHIFPVLTLVLPLLILVGIFYKIARETRSKSSDHES